MQERLELPAAVGADEGVQLVDHHRVERAEQAGDLQPAADEGGLQRFRRHQQDAGRPLARLPLVRRRHVAVPAEHRHLQRLARRVEAAELVVDQRLQRADVEQAEAARRLARDAGDQWKEGGLRLAARGLGRHDHVPPAGHDRRDGGPLHRPQIPPLLPPHPPPDAGVELVEGVGSWGGRNGHGLLSRTMRQDARGADRLTQPKTLTDP
nr:hypothetical protein [Azospirillum oleiclasticum]